MATPSEKAAPHPPSPTRISRVFAAPRELVFRAWSSAEHVKRWFAPDGFSIPQARVQLQVGGPFEICMRAPDGTEHWARGTFAQVSPHERLVLDLRVEDGRGHGLFRAYTEVSLAETPDGTRVDIVQTYTVLDPTATPMLAGAPIGWMQTLDHLDAELGKMQGLPTTNHSVVHAVFTVERTYEAAVRTVFKALSDPLAKSKWFVGPEGKWQPLERNLDFRVGGREGVQGRLKDGPVTTFDAIYLDIIPQERIIYAYEMRLDDRKISVSLATMQLKAVAAERTTLTVTEQGAFLDGYDDAGSRERGTKQLLEQIGSLLKG